LSQLTREGRLIQVIRTLLERRELHGVSLSEQLKRYAVPMLPPGLAAPLRRRHQAMTQNDWLSSDLIRSQGNTHGAMAAATGLAGLAAPTDLKS
ncbi:hypothetical protein ABTJ91_20165, partial [Acinetobacter baumannii]